MSHTPQMSSSSEPPKLDASSSNFEEDVPSRTKRKEATESPSSSPSLLITSYSPPTKISKTLILPNWWQYTIDKAKQFLTIELADPTLKTLLETPIVGSTTLLPLPPVGGLTSRFTNSKKDGKIPCIQRDAFKSLQEFVEGKEGLTYVHGPQGVGKSFALYHLYCALSINPNNRVMYIGDCAKLNKGAYRKLYKAIVAAFALDDEFLQSIYRYTLKLDEDDWTDLMGEISDHCNAASGLTFYAIFDQHNGLKSEQRTTEPTDFIKWPEDLSGAKIIISASANNEYTPIKLEDDESPHWFSGGYTPTELAEWRRSHSFFEGEDFLDVVHTTGNIPFELDKLRRLKLKTKPNLRLDELLEEYVDERTEDMNKSHRAYLANLPKDLKSNERRCMLAAIHGLVLPRSPGPIFDRQLFFYQSHLIKPVVPLALDIVRPLLTDLDLDAFITDCVTHPKMTVDFKGRAVEHYISQRISLLRTAQLSVKQLHITISGHLAQRNTLKSCNIDIRNLTTVEFIGSQTPPSLPNGNTLFLPIAPNYPDVDFLIWDDSAKKLWAFQVTLLDNPFDHANKWAPGAPLYNAWNQFLASKNIMEIGKVWIIRSAPTTLKVPASFEGQWMFDFQDPHMDTSLYPVLRQVP
jgi:hypothetical protein